MVVDKDRDSHLLSSLLLPPAALALTVSTNRDQEYVSMSCNQCILRVALVMLDLYDSYSYVLFTGHGRTRTCCQTVSK
jgi:hypothetical protein